MRFKSRVNQKPHTSCQRLVNAAIIKCKTWLKLLRWASLTRDTRNGNNRV